VVKKYKSFKGRSPIVGIKADYLAERSIPDNIKLEGEQNTSIVIISYTLMLLYVGCAIGHLPSKVHSKFALGLGGIFVVMFSLLTSFGISFYLN